MSGLWSPLADACQDFADAYWSGADNRVLAQRLSALERAVGRTRLTYAALLSGPLPVRTMHCSRCGTAYEHRPIQASDPVPHYCSPGCRRVQKAWVREEAERRAAAGLGPCPRPDKLAYATWADADAAVAHTPDDSVGLRSYECCCGSFHIGHSNRWAAATEEKHEQHA